MGFLAFAAAAVWLSAAAESALTPRNSVVAPLVVTEEIAIEAVGCGVPASATVTLPAGVSDVRVKRPSVGAGASTRSPPASVQGNAVTLTAVADGERVCDPGASDTRRRIDPGQPASTPRVGFTQGVGVAFWNRDNPRAKAFAVRWTQFGGRKASASGPSSRSFPARAAAATTEHASGWS